MLKLKTDTTLAVSMNQNLNQLLSLKRSLRQKRNERFK